MPDILNIVLGVLIGSTIGTYIGTEIAFHRTERWLMKITKDERFRRTAVEFLKDVAERFRREYIEPELKSGRLSELVAMVKAEVIRGVVGGSPQPKRRRRSKKTPRIPDLDDLMRGV
jgi:hypothetical protein